MGTESVLAADSATARPLQPLLDEAAIRRVHLDYCRGVDRRDWELVRRYYHLDAVDHHGPYSGGAVADGPQTDFFRGAYAPDDASCDRSRQWAEFLAERGWGT
jgi:hypothetical protein